MKPGAEEEHGSLTSQAAPFSTKSTFLSLNFSNAPAPSGTDSVSSLGNSNNPLYSTAVLKVSTYGNESL